MLTAMQRPLEITRLPGGYAIGRAHAGAPVPAEIWDARGFVTVSRTPEELSVVAPEGALGTMATVERGWTLFRIEGPLDFSEIGILARLSGALAAAGIGIFVVSTYDTDYVLVKAKQAAAAAAAWRSAGCNVREPG